MTTATTNFGFLKPDPLSVSEKDRWAPILNTVVDEIDTELKTRSASYDFDGQQLIDAEIKGGRETKYDFSGDISANAVTINYANGNYQYATILGNVAITLSGFPDADIGTLTLRITQDGTGGWVVTFAGSHTIKIAGGGSLSPVTTADAINIYTLLTESATSGTPATVFCFLNAGMATIS